MQRWSAKSGNKKRAEVWRFRPFEDGCGMLEIEEESRCQRRKRAWAAEYHRPLGI